MHRIAGLCANLPAGRLAFVRERAVPAEWSWIAAA
jgi:hypothetical protein